MPAILTYAELKEYDSNILNKSANLIKTSALSGLRKDATLSTVFLSYSSKDWRHIPIIIKALRGHGGLPYIDIGGKRLPKPPSIETADVLKKCQGGLRNG